MHTDVNTRYSFPCLTHTRLMDKHKRKLGTHTLSKQRRKQHPPKRSTEEKKTFAL
jgi:hypothetical protein